MRTSTNYRGKLVFISKQRFSLLTLKKRERFSILFSRFNKVELNLNYTMVDSPETLRQLLDCLELYDMAALDTEADSMYHYKTRLCLIQITVGDSNWLLDPLSDLDISEIFKTKAMQILLLHGADYDLRLLFQKYGFVPRLVFDTMMAAKLLGKEHLGLSSLVEEYFGITLKKDNQKADWTIRPLPEDMKDYAVHDTIYLHELAAKLGEELIACGRMLWHAEICLQLVEHAQKIPLPKEEPWKITGSKHLPPRSLNLLRALFNWREQEAEKLDKPPYKILPPDLMLAIVRAASSTFPELDLSRLPRLPRRLSGEILDSFEYTLQEAMKVPVEEWPKKDPRPKPPSVVPDADLLLALKYWRDKKAEQLNIDAAMLGNRTQLITLSLPVENDWSKRYNEAGLMAWQQTIWNEILKENIGDSTL